ncbi:MAG: hypothetical protein ABL921_21515, partial [Pirellula sp.]
PTTSSRAASSPLSSPLPAVMDWLVVRREQFTDWNATISSDDSNPVARGLQIAMDKKLLQLVVDNAPWESGERIPFVRSWQRIDEFRKWVSNRSLNLASCRRIEFGQFGSDASALRGTPMRCQGTIVRVDRDDSLVTEPGFGSTSYRVLWLRPDGGGDQPVCVYVPPTCIDPSLKLEESPSVVIAGFYFKRIGYASKRGSDVAPLIQAAYVGPNGIAGRIVNTDYFDLIRAARREHAVWRAPVDYATPMSMVRLRFQSLIENMESTDWSWEPEQVVGTRWTKPLLELQRLAPEVELLTSQESWLPLSESSALVRKYAQIVSIERLPVNTSDGVGISDPFVFRCSVLPSPSEAVVTVWTQAVPQAWLKPDGTPIDEIQQPCCLVGLSTQNNERTWVWAKSIQWRLDPQLATESVGRIIDEAFPPLNDKEQFLLRNGWDLAWNDSVQSLQVEPIKPLSTIESEPFHQLLRVAKQSPYTSGSKPDSQTEPKPALVRSANDLIKTLGHSSKQRLRPLLERTELQLRVVRITRVPVVDPSLVSILGTGRYYQLDAMADIGNRSYEIKSETDPVVYYKEYPVTCVSIDLPDWLIGGGQTKNDGTQIKTEEESVWYPRIKLQASGWFYRFWSYKTKEITQSLGENKRQISPLVMIDKYERIGKDGNDREWATAWIVNGTTTLLGIAGVVVIWWYVRKKTRKSVRRGLPKRINS